MLVKVQVLVRNRNLSTTIQILSKIQILVKNRDFTKKQIKKYVWGMKNMLPTEIFEDLFRCARGEDDIPTELHPPYLWFIVGPKRGGIGPKKYQTSAWDALLSGRKRCGKSFFFDIFFNFERAGPNKHRAKTKKSDAFHRL